MILPFSTHINGKPTFFIDRIWEGLLNDVSFKDLAMFDYYHTRHKAKFLKCWDVPTPAYHTSEFSKIHTIRDDKGERWHSGRDIHFVINNRSKIFFQFAPVVKCVSAQEVFMSVTAKGLEISIDDKYLYIADRIRLSRKDGFNTLMDFEEYFIKLLKNRPNNAAHFKLIHWTDFRY